MRLRDVLLASAVWELLLLPMVAWQAGEVRAVVVPPPGMPSFTAAQVSSVASLKTATGAVAAYAVPAERKPAATSEITPFFTEDFFAEARINFEAAVHAHVTSFHIDRDILFIKLSPLDTQISIRRNVRACSEHATRWPGSTRSTVTAHGQRRREQYVEWQNRIEVQTRKSTLLI
jgi:hypothetical protein